MIKQDPDPVAGTPKYISLEANVNYSSVKLKLSLQDVLNCRGSENDNVSLYIILCTDVQVHCTAGEDENNEKNINDVSNI